jgi:hypothetical protein
MRRFILSVFFLAGVLATMHSGFAEPPAATASDRVQAAVTTTPPPAPPTSSWSSPSITPAHDGSGQDSIPSGSGWG